MSFARHVREALPAAKHAELNCGHVPQIELPRETEAATQALPERLNRSGEQLLYLARLVEPHRPDEARVGGQPAAIADPDRDGLGDERAAERGRRAPSQVAQVTMP